MSELSIGINVIFTQEEQGDIVAYCEEAGISIIDFLHKSVMDSIR